MADPSRDGETLTYERAHGESPVEAIVLGVSEATGDSPVEMPPIASVISPDAVNRILGSEGPSSVRISFEYCGKRVSATRTRVQVEGST